MHRSLRITLPLLALSLALMLVPAAARADVPIHVVNFDACTDYETSLENFIGSALGAVEEKLENFFLTFRLGQIEKAREDVAKLVYETQQELKDEALLTEYKDFYCTAADETTGICTETRLFFHNILRSRGITAIKGDDKVCPGGYMADLGTGQQECVLIKKEGRIITNVDEYLYEEPIEKARHYLQCYLAPWRFFPFADDTERCAEVGLTGEACTSRAVCEKLRAQGEQCKSDTLRDQLKFEMLNKIQRKNRYLYRNTNPPENWYTPERCDYILSFLTAPRCTTDEAGNTVCPDNAPPPLGGGETDFVKRQEEWARYRRFKEEEPDLDGQPSDVGNKTQEWGEYRQSLEPKNSFPGVAQKVDTTVQEVIKEYQDLREAEYLAGQGIRPEKYLIGWFNVYEGVGRCNENFGGKVWGRVLEGCDPQRDDFGIYYFSTEDVIAPAVVLLQKMQAATQAQFDLAQQAYKYPSDQEERATFTNKPDVEERGPGGKGPHEPNEPPGDAPTGPLPRGCENYRNDFQEVAQAKGVDTCLLEAIAAAESSCNPNAVSAAGACGMMQLLPSTAGITCSELKSNPRKSIELAADYLQQISGNITRYNGKYGYDVGSLYTQTNQTTQYGANTYDTGNDDLIASYNAGFGDRTTGGRKGPFAPSADCANPATPSWQCNINPGGFRETQTYVQRVQNYQDQCTTAGAVAIRLAHNPPPAAPAKPESSALLQFTGGGSSGGFTGGGGNNIGGECTSIELEGKKPALNVLPAPWEDLGNAEQNKEIAERLDEGDRPYTQVPDLYIRRLNEDGTVAKEAEEPRDYGPRYSLNYWYKNVVELYEHSFTQPQNAYQGTLPSVLNSWFQPEAEPVAGG